MTLVVGHRGAAAHAPENSIAAFEHAIELGADMVEFDVRRDPDGELVVSHDPLPQPNVATLEQVVAVCAGRIALDVELKEPGLEEDTLRLVAGTDFVITSFLADAVAATKRLRPDVRVGLLLGSETRAIPDPTPADFLAPHYVLLDRLPLPSDGLVVWTVNDAALLERLFEDPRVAAVVTDDLALALAVRAQPDRSIQ
jgi:glycerophosphoryl diester phosphodiesterase